MHATISYTYIKGVAIKPQQQHKTPKILQYSLEHPPRTLATQSCAPVPHIGKSFEDAALTHKYLLIHIHTIRTTTSTQGRLAPLITLSAWLLSFFRGNGICFFLFLVFDKVNAALIARSVNRYL